LRLSKGDLGRRAYPGKKEGVWGGEGPLGLHCGEKKQFVLGSEGGGGKEKKPPSKGVFSCLVRKGRA